MKRLKINFPENCLFTWEYELGISDMNYGGHLDNARFLGIAHEARMAFFKSLGVSEIDFYGLSVIMADAQIVYQCEGHTFDKITVDVGIGDVGNSGFVMFYRLYNQNKQKPMAIISTTILCYDYNASKVLPLPASFLSAIKQ